MVDDYYRWTWKPCLGKCENVWNVGKVQKVF